jgi:hypothetical protein
VDGRLILRTCADKDKDGTRRYCNKYRNYRGQKPGLNKKEKEWYIYETS